MIRWLLAGLAALLAGGGVAALALRDPGYILVAWDRFSVETSIWVASILLLAAGTTVWLLARALRQLLAVPPALRDWRSGRRADRARRDTLRGLALLMQDQPQAALKLLRAAADDEAMAPFAWPAAADAAHRSGDFELRDQCLVQALAANPEAREALDHRRQQWQAQSTVAAPETPGG